MVGQEYELEHKLEGRPKSTSEKLDQTDQVKGDSRGRIAKEHNISPATVQRSADLYKAHKAIGEVAPEMTRELLWHFGRMGLEKARENRRNSPTPI